MSESTSGRYTPGETTYSFNFDKLIAGDFPLITDTVTLTGGALFKRGTLLGKITASGKFTVATSAATDGSQTPVRVLADHSDTTGSDVTAGVYRTGEFNANSIVIGTGIVLNQAAIDALAAMSIFIKPAISAT